MGDQLGPSGSEHGALRTVREADIAVVGGRRGARLGVRARRLRLGLRHHGRGRGRLDLVHVLLLQVRAASHPRAPRRAARRRSGGAAAAWTGQRRRRRRRRWAQTGGRRSHPGVRVPTQDGGAGGAVRGVHQRRAERGDGEEAAVVRARVPRAVRRRVAVRARHMPYVPRRRQGRRR